jgi:Family of unknown function (DUF6804)
MKFIKILLAALLFLCLADMPYGYYQFIRYLFMVVFAVYAYDFYKRGNIPSTILFIALAVLFQPFFKVALGRQMWNIIDVVVAVALIVSVILPYAKKESQKTS